MYQSSSVSFIGQFLTSLQLGLFTLILYIVLTSFISRTLEKEKVKVRRKRRTADVQMADRNGDWLVDSNGGEENNYKKPIWLKDPAQLPEVRNGSISHVFPSFWHSVWYMFVEWMNECFIWYQGHHSIVSDIMLIFSD